MESIRFHNYTRFFDIDSLCDWMPKLMRQLKKVFWICLRYGLNAGEMLPRIIQAGFLWKNPIL